MLIGRDLLLIYNTRVFAAKDKKFLRNCKRGGCALAFMNHPRANWSQEQISAAYEYGEILDIPFPEVDPHGDERYLDNLASQYAE